ncbi:hypothetical protein GGR53DRAFT_467207 [Hypoxylon sp. FL1150]|nr:hypothetical protein GGR53DRAFT_467207 [Hypoxylon sp. FL1150]
MAAGISLLALEGLLCTSGVGHPVGEIGNNAMPLLRLIMIQNALSIGATIACKLGIAFFYLRVFVKARKTRVASYMSMVFFVAWGVVCFVDMFVLCGRNASGTPKATCDRSEAMANVSLFSIIGDVLIILIPIPAVWKLKMNRSSKIKLTILFLLGLIVTIIAIMRCVSITLQDFSNGKEFTVMFQDPLAYAVLEANIAVLCASLPMVHNELSTWKTKLFAKVKSAPKSEPDSSQLESAHTEWKPSTLSGDPRYGYRVSVTVGKDNHEELWSNYVRSALS